MDSGALTLTYDPHLPKWQFSLSSTLQYCSNTAKFNFKKLHVTSHTKSFLDSTLDRVGMTVILSLNKLK